MERELNEKKRSTFFEPLQNHSGRTKNPPPFQLKAGSVNLPQEGKACTNCDCENGIAALDLPQKAAQIANSGEEMSEPELQELGQYALHHIGMERLLELSEKTGFQTSLGGDAKNKAIPTSQIVNGDDRVIQRNSASVTFGRYLASAGTASVADGPLPIGEIIGIGLLVIGAIHAGYILMSSHGNQADSGIMEEAQELIRTGLAATICEALKMLMSAAKAAGDKQKMGRIKATQKAKGCRHSRHS